MKWWPREPTFSARGPPGRQQRHIRLFDAAAEMMEARDSLNEGWLDCVVTLMAVLTVLRQKMSPDDKSWDDFGIARQQCRLYATLF